VDQGSACPPPRDQFSTTPREQANLWELCYTHAWQAPTRLQIYFLDTHERLPASLKLNTWCTQKMYASTASGHVNYVSRSHWLYFSYAVHCDYSSPGCSGSTSTMSCDRVARLVVDYFAYAARPGASARRTARRRLLRIRRVSRCLGMSRGSSRGSSSTTSPRAARRRLLRFTRLVVDYLAYATRPGALARRAAHRVARRRLLCLTRLVATTSPTPRV
jgi:hypothetical protein